MKNGKLEILTWHVHGNYLYYLTHADCMFYIPVTSPKSPGYWGITNNFSWGKNVCEIPSKKVKEMEFDCIIFQSNFSLKDPDFDFLQDQIKILSKKQLLQTPKIFIEHDPPRKHPTDSKHILFDSSIPIVQVTHFNNLMWNTGTTPTNVITHGVIVPETAQYTGEIAKGIVVINSLATRGRRLGKDIFEKAREQIPLDLVGMDSKKLGGLGEVSPHNLPFLLRKYRFFFHPARYTSLGLSVIEAMMVGLPIVGFATTELPTVIQNGRQGYVHTDINFLISHMRDLLLDKSLAKKLGKNAKKTARKRFSIETFTQKWENFIKKVIQSYSIVYLTQGRSHLY